jgi:hypothetical protein
LSFASDRGQESLVASPRGPGKVRTTARDARATFASPRFRLAFLVIAAADTPLARTLTFSAVPDYEKPLSIFERRSKSGAGFRKSNA